ncbi:MAG: hypothetical protein ACLQDF_07980 [Desulfomonilia bacterium]
MADSKKKKLGVNQVLAVQVVVSFVVIAVLIVVGGLLIFRVMGAEYTQFTVAGFIATVYMAFITFQPAGTLFAARKELIEGKVELPTGGDAGADRPVGNPWLMTLPVSFPIALLCTAIIMGIIYGTGWTPRPRITLMLSLLYVIPHYLITSRFIGRDLTSLAAKGLGAYAGVISKKQYFWKTYILPNFIFQLIINCPIANRGFHQEMLKLSREFPNLQGLLPVKAVVVDHVITFMFVCNFTFLAAIMYTPLGFYLGIITLDGLRKGKGIHGFLYFLIMLFMGIVVGILYGLAFNVAGVENIPFATAMISKVVCVFIAVYLGSYMAMGWTAKKIRAHMAAQAGSAG